MAEFTVTGDVDPFLHVSLKRGEKIYCESNAMVMMENGLELKGKMTGGIGGALTRVFATGESFFQQHIEAVRSDGDCLLSPALPGAIQVLEVGRDSYMLTDGAFCRGRKWRKFKRAYAKCGFGIIRSFRWFFCLRSHRRR
ncbi:AIM24 family protein [Methylocucumis oryzae]|uniref:AIM24 family protein n=1 Tax=Methylocucumis oryzae TaxID=1632867 RepID=UPI000B1932B3|nr:AIM24 family protein [Methylocucumis oryzae]